MLLMLFRLFSSDIEWRSNFLVNELLKALTNLKPPTPAMIPPTTPSSMRPVNVARKGASLAASVPPPLPPPFPPPSSVSANPSLSATPARPRYTSPLKKRPARFAIPLASDPIPSGSLNVSSIRQVT